MSADEAPRPGGFEGPVKTAAGAAALGVSVLYLFGYLSLRQQITTLGIPAEFSVFDERYLYAGASYLVFLTQAIADMAVLVIPIAALLVIARAVFLRRRRGKETWISPELLPRLECRSKRTAALLAAIAGFAALRSVQAARSWTSLHDLLFEPGFRPEVANVLNANLLEWYRIFDWHLTLSLGCALLTAAALRSPLSRAWGAIALATVAAQFLSLPLLFGAITADRPKPRIKFQNGETGLLVWEDKDVWMYLRTESPPVVVRRPKDSKDTVMVTGYRRVLCAQLPGPDCR
jgi:hypothetical protein